MNDIVKSAWASVKMNADFICVETYSGYRSNQYDPQGVQHLSPPDVGDKELGEMVKDALAHSRFVLSAPRTDVWIHPEVTFDSELYDYKATAERYAEWIRKLMDRYGYKTKRALFKDMKSCEIRCANEVITITPSWHEKLEMWSGDRISDVDHVILSMDSPSAEIGAGLRLALNRCK
ncbi:CdiI family contact-dependent growth inhibition immunity protein [Buttiauxella sp. A2-C2_NF]|uniref:contact-dependent growth inhibition system immunity protein n=1 Tax=Buttiauxella ferragutiae TaxID=82989 RepID=UPI001E3BB160|nr:contact-dependent growth inhibition system immunity protein [Buttiauxella ferragutiae]MCE0828995.1 CdiI family contact-dependent growth inhibition immunity protein [Buttiauxella ferragutiae]UNK63049.1 contact-dependent growth inhibition system immunity protein [Buttiauxella ferragutiae]